MTAMNKRTDRYYRYDPNANHFTGFALNEDDFDVLKLHSQSKAVSKKWQGIKLAELEDSPRELGDFPSLVDRRRLPLFSERAWSVLGPHLNGVAEALPVTTSYGYKLYLINVFRFSDALREEDCRVDRYSDGGIRRVLTFSFDKQRTENQLLMKLPPCNGGDLIVTEFFRQIVEDKKLLGLNFEELKVEC